MECEEARAALSARLDGEPEPAGTDPDAVDAHLAACPDCPVWFAAAADLNRRLRVSAAPTEEPQPRDAGELARQMSALAENTPELSQRLRSRSLPLTLCRVVLVVLAVLYIAWAVVLLVNSTDVPDSPSVAGAGGEVANSGDPDLARAAQDACARHGDHVRERGALDVVLAVQRQAVGAGRVGVRRDAIDLLE